MLWIPIMPETGLKAFIDRRMATYADLQSRLVDELKKVKQEPEQKIHDNVTVIGGFREVFSLVTQRMKASARTVDILSVGEQIPTPLEVESAKTVGRGIRLRFIATSHTAQNRQLLEKWQKDGWIVRHLPGSKEYSFAVFDRSSCAIIVKNPTITDERILILFDNKDLSGALGEYFATLWKRAKPI
jgi:hypothetical protein